MKKFFNNIDWVMMISNIEIAVIAVNVLVGVYCLIKAIIGIDPYVNVVWLAGGLMEIAIAIAITYFTYFGYVEE